MSSEVDDVIRKAVRSLATAVTEYPPLPEPENVASIYTSAAPHTERPRRLSARSSRLGLTVAVAATVLVLLAGIGVVSRFLVGNSPEVAAVDSTGPSNSTPISPSSTTVTEPWPVGPEFTASEFEVDGQTRQHPVKLISLAADSVYIDLGACGYGGNAIFDIQDDRLILSGFGRDLIYCDPQPEEVTSNASLLQDLFLSKPQIATTPGSITISAEGIRLTLTTPDPTANTPVAPTGQRFQATSSADPEIEVAHVSLVIQAIFAMDVQLQRCVAHAQVGGLEATTPRDVITGVDPSDCRDPSPSDQAVRGHGKVPAGGQVRSPLVAIE